MPKKPVKITLASLSQQMDRLGEKFDHQLQFLNKKVDGVALKVTSIEKRMATKADIDELAGMVARGFEDVETRVTERIDTLESKLKLEQRITVLERRAAVRAKASY